MRTEEALKKTLPRQRSGTVNLQSRDMQELNLILQYYMTMGMAWHRTKKKRRNGIEKPQSRDMHRRNAILATAMSVVGV